MATESVRRIMVVCAAATCLAASCPKPVPVPPPDQDRPPVVKVHVTPSGPTRVSVQEASSDAAVRPCYTYVTLGGDAVITAAATNPGGVQSISLKVTENVAPFSTRVLVQRSATPDSSGNVPTVLSILGHDGAGGIGSNPVLFHAEAAQANGLVVTATATNFHGQATTVTLAALPLLPLSASIAASPTTIDAGQAAQLTWGWGSASTVRIPALGISDAPVVCAFAGARQVTPAATTKYTLSVTNFLYDECTKPDPASCAGAQALSRSVTVQVRAAQPTGERDMRIWLSAVGAYSNYRQYEYEFTAAQSGHLVRITFPQDNETLNIPAISLLKAGRSTNECGNPDAVRQLTRGSSTSDMAELFGTSNPSFAQAGHLVACVSSTVTVEKLPVIIRYTD
jgi:hypothetical protein